MKEEIENQNEFNEKESFQVIQNMIQVARQRHAQDGILFIVWGWLMVVSNLIFSYIPQFMVTTQLFRNLLNYVYIFIWIGVILFTLVYLIKRYSRVRTYTGITLLFVWVGVVAFMLVSNLIHNHFLIELMDQLSPPIEYYPMALSQMILVAYAILITGIVLRHWLVIFGSILFGVFVVLSSYVDLQWILIMQVIGWTVAFIIPGHIIYAKRNRHA